MKFELPLKYKRLYDLFENMERVNRFFVLALLKTLFLGSVDRTSPRKANYVYERARQREEKH